MQPSTDNKPQDEEEWTDPKTTKEQPKEENWKTQSALQNHSRW